MLHITRSVLMHMELSGPRLTVPVPARITGGVTGMPQFLDKFFPSVARAQRQAKGHQNSAYCTFDDASLQAWTSSMFIAGAFTGERSCMCPSAGICACIMCCSNRTLPACQAVHGVRSSICFLNRCALRAALAVAFFPKFFQRLGRKYTMMIGAGCFCIGAALQASRTVLCLRISICEQKLPMSLDRKFLPGHFDIRLQQRLNLVLILCITLQAAAHGLAELIVGRIFLGVGIGLANQVSRGQPLAQCMCMPYPGGVTLGPVTKTWGAQWC